MAKASITLQGSRSHRCGDKVYTLGQTFVSSDPQEIAYCKARKDIFAVGHVPEPKPVAKQSAPVPAPSVEKTVEKVDEESTGKPISPKRSTGPKTRKRRVQVGR